VGKGGYETTLKRTRLNTATKDDDLVDNPFTPQTHPNGENVSNVVKENGGVGAYNEELIAMVKRPLEADRK
jgi:hypothetical protein